MSEQKKIIVHLPKLTDYQAEVDNWMFNHHFRGKTTVIKSPRQVGKTTFGLLECIKFSFMDKRVLTSAIYEPTLNLARQVFKTCLKIMPKELIASSNATLLEITFTNECTILFRSMEQISRGLTISGILVIDEAAYCDDEGIYTLLPLVNAHNAPILILSTPFTEEGFFYDMYIKGLEGSDRNLKAFDWAKHKGIEKFLTAERKAFYKETMSKAKYQTEIEADFLHDDGLLFTNLQHCIGSATYKEGRVYLGLDYGAGGEGDYTVLCCINSRGEQLGRWSTNSLTPTEQVEWLKNIIADLNGKYTIATLLAEKNSIGKVMTDMLNKALKTFNLQITDFVTTNESKREIIEDLQTAFEKGDIKIMEDAVQLNELKKYAMEMHKTNGKTYITYNGVNCHDDTVMALAFAYHAYKKSMGQFRLVLK